MEDRQDITVPMPGALVETIEKNLEYGDARSTWIRDAVRIRLALERGDTTPLDDLEQVDVDDVVDSIEAFADSSSTDAETDGGQVAAAN